MWSANPVRYAIRSSPSDCARAIDRKTTGPSPLSNARERTSSLGELSQDTHREVHTIPAAHKKIPDAGVGARQAIDQRAMIVSVLRNTRALASFGQLAGTTKEDQGVYQTRRTKETGSGKAR